MTASMAETTSTRTVFFFYDLVVEANRCDKQEEEEEEVVARVDRAPHATARVGEVEAVPDVVGGQGGELHFK